MATTKKGGAGTWGSGFKFVSAAAKAIDKKTKGKDVKCRVVTAPAGTTMTVEMSGKTVTVRLVKGLSAAAGDVVLVHVLGSSMVATSVYTHAPAGYIAPDPIDDVPVAGALVVPPVETRSYRDGEWRNDTDDLFQGTYGPFGNSTGCAYYGPTLQALAGATIVSASVRLKRLSGGDVGPAQPILRLLGDLYRPEEGPTLQAAAATGPTLAVGASTDTFTVPNSWITAMVAGTAGGIGIFTPSGAPYLRLAGQSAWGQSFVLVVLWSRS